MSDGTSITAAEIMAAIATLRAAPKVSYVVCVSDDGVVTLHSIPYRSHQAWLERRRNRHLSSDISP